ncbi:MAG: UDP-glucose/GDP-mannose dehydrogenase family protein [Methanosarcinales archaeon Met12]|nr:MAG: UDP-glucose/GDP-mannose dehydrogenase family protein [Methanosarcinales archaeon Met12]
MGDSSISIIGAGYVGAVTAACLAELGHNVCCIDVDAEKVDNINAGIPPIHEEGLEELFQKHAGKMLVAATDYTSVADSDVSFICVGTPSAQDGEIDLSVIKTASKSIGISLRNNEKYHVIAVKSTVVPETTQNVVIPIVEEYSQKRAGTDFGVAVNPEFLREGRAVHDFMNPDRIVIGELDKRSGGVVAQLYEGFDCPLIRTGLKTAEMIKYASNAFLATKISFANEIGNICKELGIDTYEVMHAVGLDHRISPSFLRAGAGFGGSCFPKDMRALIHKAEELGYRPKLLRSVMDVNEGQPKRMIRLLERKLGNLSGRKIAVLGLAFKNDTDDIRESRAIPVIHSLIEKKAIVSAYDPLANENMRPIFPNIRYHSSAKDALKDVDACLVMTEWDEFKKLGDEFKVMKNRIVIDGRNIIAFREHIDYEGLCW